MGGRGSKKSRGAGASEEFNDMTPNDIAMAGKFCRYVLKDIRCKCMKERTDERGKTHVQ